MILKHKRQQHGRTDEFTSADLWHAQRDAFPTHTHRPDHTGAHAPEAATQQTHCHSQAERCHGYCNTKSTQDDPPQHDVLLTPAHGLDPRRSAAT